MFFCVLTLCWLVIKVLGEAAAFVYGLEGYGHCTHTQNISDNLLTVLCHFTGNSYLLILCYVI
jgi:hypothetical protein